MNPLHLKIGLLLLAALLLGVLELVRRRLLSEKYSLLWLASAVVMILLLVFYGVFMKLVGLLKIHNPPTLLFVISFFFLMAIVLQYSLAISKLSDRTRLLAQKVAILEERLADLKGTAEGGSKA